MTPIEYCKQKLHYPGSDLYYSCLGLEEKKQHLILAIHALAKEILDIPYTVLEESIARQKLAWWHEQINLLYEGQGQHPVMKAILENAELSQLPKPLMDELIAGAMNTLSTHQCESEKEYFVHCYYYHGITQLLCLYENGFNGKAHFANHLGICLQTASLIGSLRNQIIAGKLYFPKTHLEQHQLSFEDFKARKVNNKIKEFLQFEINYAKDFYKRALEKLPKNEKPVQSIVFAGLALKRIDEIARDGFQVFDHDVHLTPIRKLFYRWKLLCWPLGH